MKEVNLKFGDKKNEIKNQSFNVIHTQYNFILLPELYFISFEYEYSRSH